MNKKTEESVAESLDAGIEILPYLPDLLIDLWSLGSAIDSIIDMVRALNLSNSAHLLDLGCGKGATTITLAHRLGLRVTGIDANPEFLRIAHQKASEYHVSERCQFILADIFDYIKQPKKYDLVVYASLGGLLGNYKQTVSQLRRMVKADGYMIIDDGYLKGGVRLDRKGYEHYLPHTSCIEQLTFYGDIIVQEVSTVDESRQINQEYLASIRKQGYRLLQKRPELEALLIKYIEKQETECAVIEEFISGATWLLKKII